QTQEMRRVYPPNGIGLSGTLGRVLAPKGPVHDVRITGGGVESPRIDRLSTGKTLILRWKSLPDPKQGALFQRSAPARDDSVRADALAGREAGLTQCGHGASCMPLEVAHDFLAQMPREPLPDPRPSSKEAVLDSIWRDVLFLLRHRLTPTVFVTLPIRW